MTSSDFMPIMRPLPAPGRRGAPAVGAATGRHSRPWVSMSAGVAVCGAHPREGQLNHGHRVDRSPEPIKMLATRPGQTPQAIQLIKFANNEQTTLERNSGSFRSHSGSSVVQCPPRLTSRGYGAVKEYVLQHERWMAPSPHLCAVAGPAHP